MVGFYSLVLMQLTTYLLHNTNTLTFELLFTTSFQIRVRIGNYFLDFSSLAYVVVTQKNPLNETVLLSTQKACLN